MARTVVALYDDFASANAAVRDLVDNGFSRDDISLMASDAEGTYGNYITGREVTDVETSGATEGAGVGAGVGAVVGGLGGLLVGLGALAIPGVGPVIAAGPLAAALTGLAGAGVGAVAGGITGGLLGALVDMGIPEESAHYYAEGVRRGGTLVSLRASDDMTNRAVDIMNRHNPVDINQRATQWRETGWTAFHEDAEPYTRTSTTTTMRGTTGASMFETDRVEGMETRGVDSPRGTYHPEEGGRESPDVYSEDRPDLYKPERGGDQMPIYSDFDTYETDFRHHYETTMTDTGYTYDQYMPAYRYGYDLATDARYRELDWDRLEPEARRYWDERNPGTWERFKMAVRHAWEEIKDTVD